MKKTINETRDLMNAIGQIFTGKPIKENNGIDLNNMNWDEFYSKLNDIHQFFETFKKLKDVDNLNRTIISAEQFIGKLKNLKSRLK